MSINVNAGETVNDVFLSEDQMNVYSEGVANNTLVDQNSILTVYKGGTINTTYISNMGEVDLAGVANDTQINTNGYLTVGEDGLASNTTVEGGNFSINSGGIAVDTTINAPGSMTVWADGKTGGSTTVNEGGTLILEWGWLHQDLAVHGGKATLKGDTMNAADGWLMGYTVDSGGSLTVDGYGSAYNGTITDGFATVHNMGKIENVVLDNATVEVKNGAMLSNATMNTGTVVSAEDGASFIGLTVSAGAVLTGVLNNILGLTFDGGTLDLNIEAMSPGDAVRVSAPVFNDISAGTYSCTLTVKDSGQTNGTYSLIEAISSFDKTITVKNASGVELGTLKVGESLTVGMSKYTLGLDTTGLYVTVGTGNVFTGDVTDEVKYITGDWTALNVNLNAYGVLQVYEGGVASKTKANEYGSLEAYNGGFAYDTDVNSNGYEGVYEGGSASGATVASDGAFAVSTGGAAENVKVLAGGSLYHSSGASIKDIDADEGAYLEFTVGEKTYAAGKYAGTAFELKDTADGFAFFNTLYVTKGGTAVNTVVNKDKWLYVVSTGAANNTTVNADGRMRVSSGGAANNTTVNADGNICVADGGTAKVAYVSGIFCVEEDGVADIVHVGNLGGLSVSAGGVATNIIVDEGGEANVSGGFAGNVTVNKGGYTYISEGGLVSGAVVADGAILGVYGDGVLSDLTVSAGGKLWAYGKGKLTGKMTFEAGAVVDVSKRGTIDFDLRQSTAVAEPLLNDFSFVTDDKLSFTLTVDGTQANGLYYLAGNAADFGDRTLTVVNDSGETLGTLTFADGEKEIDGVEYTLKQ